MTAVAFAAGLLSPGLAYAYLDPGTGSMIIQMLIAGALGAMLYMKLAWAKTKDVFARLFPGSRSGQPPDDSGPEGVKDGDLR
jgi:hypothetical protein